MPAAALALVALGATLPRLLSADDSKPAAPAADAAPPAPYLLPFQGRLTDAKGKPIPEGEAKALFAIYDAPTAGTALWTSGPLTLKVEPGGLVHALLGDAQHPLDKVDFGRPLYLGVRVHDPDPKSQAILENEPEMLPRVQVLPALHARKADEADHAKRADDAVTVQGFNIFPKGGDKSGARIPGKMIDPLVLVPPGTIMPYCGRIDKEHRVPAGWLACDGTIINGRDEKYKALFEALGDSWGDGGDNDPYTINLADLRAPIRQRLSASAAALQQEIGAGESRETSAATRGEEPEDRAGEPVRVESKVRLHWLIKY